MSIMRNGNVAMINNGQHWDEYVREWEKSGETKSLKYLGNEWKGEEIFLSLLEKYALRGQRALEIGCGGGRVTSKGVEVFKRVYATDVSKEMLRKCQERVAAKNVSYHHLDGFTLDKFENDSIDCIYSHDVFVHFSSLQVYPYFEEMKRVLKKGGLGIVSFYNFRVHFNRFQEISRRFNTERVFPPHMRLHFITEEILRLMLEDLSLEIVEIEKENFLIVVFRKK